jgi:hypothetical protein
MEAVLWSVPSLLLADYKRAITVVSCRGLAICPGQGIIGSPIRDIHGYRS